MNSLDTNILIYAVNEGCVEHRKAKAVYEKILQHPQDWIISDQVLIEFYRALRNSKILEHPLSHTKALEQVVFLREKSGILHCDYEPDFWSFLWKKFEKGSQRSIHIFDCRLGVTLEKNQVKLFYTRNTFDFSAFSFQSINPIDLDE